MLLFMPEYMSSSTYVSTSSLPRPGTPAYIEGLNALEPLPLSAQMDTIANMSYGEVGITVGANIADCMMDRLRAACGYSSEMGSQKAPRIF